MSKSIYENFTVLRYFTLLGASIDLMLPVDTIQAIYDYFKKNKNSDGLYMLANNSISNNVFMKNLMAWNGHSINLVYETEMVAIFRIVEGKLHYWLTFNSHEVTSGSEVMNVVNILEQGNNSSFKNIPDEFNYTHLAPRLSQIDTLNSSSNLDNFEENNHG